MLIKLSNEEKDIIKDISILSNINENQVKEVFQTLLSILTLNMKKDNYSINIPMIGKLNINRSSDNSNISHAIVLKTMLKEIYDDAETNINIHLKAEIAGIIADNLGITIV